MVDQFASTNAFENAGLLAQTFRWYEDGDRLADDFFRRIAKKAAARRRFQLVMIPSRFFATIASSEDSDDRGRDSGNCAPYLSRR